MPAPDGSRVAEPLGPPENSRALTAPDGVRRLLSLLRGLSARALFLALGLPVGLFLVFAVPPSQGLDEPDHFFRAYSISDGTIVSPIVNGHAGSVLPVCVSAYAIELYLTATQPGRLHFKQFLQEPAGCADQEATFVEFDNSSLYSPVSYLPQLVGIRVARWFGAPVPGMFYAGRLLGFLCYAALAALALTIAPRGRPVLLAVALMPMSLLLGSEFSADGITIALSLLLVAAVIRCCWDPRATWRSFVLAAAAAAALSLSKSTYFALAPLLLLVPTRLFPSAWWAAGAKAGALGVTGLLAAAWYLQVRGINAGYAAFPAVIDPGQQVQNLLHHKWWYLGFVLNTLFGPDTGYFTWPGFVSWLGFSRNVAAGSPEPPPLIMAAGIALVGAAYVREAPQALVVSTWSLARGAIPVLLVAINAFLIVTALYLAAVPVGGTVLWLQGRYLLPLTAVPVISLLVLGAGEARRPSLAPLLPLLLVLLGYLVVRVPQYFYT